jgi:hypothetical protein
MDLNTSAQDGMMKEEGHLLSAGQISPPVSFSLGKTARGPASPEEMSLWEKFVFGFSPPTFIPISPLSSRHLLFEVSFPFWDSPA